MSNLTPASAKIIPSHVPPELVLTHNPWIDLRDHAHQSLQNLQARGNIIYTPVHHIPGLAPNGSWMVTRSALAREILRDTETFSSENTTGIGRSLGEDLVLAPIECDPPLHTQTRKFLGPFFTPSAVRVLEGRIRQRAEALIEAVLPLGGCDFMDSYAKILPSEIFLELADMPREDLPSFLEWEDLIMNSHELKDRVLGLRSTADYLRDIVSQRRAKPGEDLISAIIRMEIDGKRISDAQALGIALLFYIAGLDTVVNSLGWQFRHLARNPADQELLRQDRKMIPKAVEEMLRGFSLVSMTRIVMKDIEIGGVSMKQGDVISIPSTIISRDLEEYPDPDKIDFNRSTTRHFAFGFGPHLCIGMNLARLELVNSLDLWLTKVPQFRLQEGAELNTIGGATLALEKLPLTWR